MRKPTDEEFAQARAGREERMKGPLAKSAAYDVIILNTGIEIAFVPEQIQNLGGATADELHDVVIRSSGLSIHWPRLDADFSVQNLLLGFTGTQKWMAAQLGAAGGKARSEVKTAKSRENGKRGGRPAIRA
jgi:hypothetical protein